MVNAQITTLGKVFATVFIKYILILGIVAEFHTYSTLENKHNISINKEIVN